MVFDLLSELAPGEACSIHAINLDEAMCKRLEEMGLCVGAKIRCANKAPSGSPIAFWINGAMVAIRATDCRKIQIYRKRML